MYIFVTLIVKLITPLRDIRVTIVAKEMQCTCAMNTSTDTMCRGFRCRFNEPTRYLCQWHLRQWPDKWWPRYQWCQNLCQKCVLGWFSFGATDNAFDNWHYKKFTLMMVRNKIHKLNKVFELSVCPDTCNNHRATTVAGFIQKPLYTSSSLPYFAFHSDTLCRSRVI